jgi:hypothetical protein
MSALSARHSKDGHATIPNEILHTLRLVCLDLPDAYEASAWVGMRWCVRKKNFAHVVMIDGGWPPAYAQAAQCDGPACVLTFRLPPAQIDAPRFTSAPFFRPVWFANIAGVVLDERTDWDDIERMLINSYRVLAPKKLTALIDRA